MILDDPLEITMYLSTAERFETELNLSQQELKTPYYIRNVNLFTQDIALSPSLDNELVSLDPNNPVQIQNLRQNISFEGDIVQTHGRRLVILKIPKTINFTNTRDSERFAPGPKNASDLSVLKKDAYNPVTVKNVHLMDFSEKGFALRVMNSRCPQIEIGDNIQVNLRQDDLPKIQGTVTYKKYVDKRSDHPAFSKIGLKFDKDAPLATLQKIYA